MLEDMLDDSINTENDQESDIDVDFTEEQDLAGQDSDSDHEEETEDDPIDPTQPPKWSENLVNVTINDFTEPTGPLPDLVERLMNAEPYSFFLEFFPELMWSMKQTAM